MPAKLFTERNWHWIEDPLATDPQAGLSRDTELLHAIGRGDQPATIRLWENPQSLIVTRRETRLPHYNEACEKLEEAGWPVLVRESGGTAVPHHAGILHLSLIFPLTDQDSYDIDAVYKALCLPIQDALQQIGLDADYGSVPGSYCDGRFNLVAGRRKITGTAQRVMVASPQAHPIRQVVLAQAMLMVESDAAAATELVNRFYNSAGDTRRYDPEVSASVGQLLREMHLRTDNDDTVAELRRGIKSSVVRLLSQSSRMDA